MPAEVAPHPPSAPRWPLRISLVLALGLVVGVLIAAAVVRNHTGSDQAGSNQAGSNQAGSNQAGSGQTAGPLGLVALPAPSATSVDCERLLAALPATLDGGERGDLSRRQLTAPAPAGAVGWGQPPVVLRCGLARPAELTATSRLLDVSGVQFLEIATRDVSKEGTSSWVAVDRPVYVAVALPPTSGSAPLQQIAAVIGNTLPQRGVDVTG